MMRVVRSCLSANRIARLPSRKCSGFSSQSKEGVEGFDAEDLGIAGMFRN